MPVTHRQPHHPELSVSQRDKSVQAAAKSVCMLGACQGTYAAHTFNPRSLEAGTAHLCEFKVLLVFIEHAIQDYIVRPYLKTRGDKTRHSLVELHSFSGKTAQQLRALVALP